jgi:hypothetical protein
MQGPKPEQLFIASGTWHEIDKLADAFCNRCACEITLTRPASSASAIRAAKSARRVLPPVDATAGMVLAMAAAEAAIIAADRAEAAATAAFPPKPRAAMALRARRNSDELYLSPVTRDEVQRGSTGGQYDRSTRLAAIDQWEADCQTVMAAHRVEELQCAAEAAQQRAIELAPQLAEIHAGSPAGMAVKLRYLVKHEAIDLAHDDILESLLADAERLAGGEA